MYRTRGIRTQNNSFAEDVLIPYFGIEKPIVGIEIGVASGGGSLGMLYRMPNLTLYGVDTWIHKDGEQYELGGWSQDNHNEGKAQAENRLKEFGDRAKLIHATSDEAVNLIPNECDFVFIDGHHQYDQVVKDIANYNQKIRVGGLICGHDFIQVPDVTRAVYEKFDPIHIRQADDFIWWVIKV